MDSSKIKNIIIIVLIFVNAFMLILLLMDRSEANSAARAAREYAEQVFEDNGIVLSESVELSNASSGTYSLLRDMDAEKKIVSSLLGDIAVDELGGNIYCYIGAKGTAKFRGAGEFEILMTSGDIAAGSDPVQTARSVLRQMGIDSDKESAVLEVSDDGESVAVTLTCVWKDDLIINCQVRFEFFGDNLTLIMGKRPLDRISAKSEEDMLSAQTVLMRFLDIIRSSGYVCSEILSMEQAYVMEDSVLGGSTLNPVWEIETDAGKYYINGVTGKAENLSF